MLVIATKRDVNVNANVNVNAAFSLTFSFSFRMGGHLSHMELRHVELKD